MSGQGNKRRRQRTRLSNAQGGLCFWCKKPMRLLELHELQRLRHPPPDLCTIDHLEPRWHPKRGEFGGQQRLVAACLKCNNERDREQLALVPRELLHAAAAGTPARQLAHQFEAELAQVFTVIAVPPRKPLRFTFEPEPKQDPGPFRVKLAELAKSR